MSKRFFSFQHLPMHLLRLLLVLLASLPYRLQYAVGIGLGKLVYWLAKSRIQIARTNLTLCYPEKSADEVEGIIRANCASAGVGLVETATCWFMPLGRFKTIYTVKGLEHIEQAQAEGKGVILLGFHFTTLEIGGSIVADNSEKLAAMYRPHNNAFFEHMMCGGRLRHAERVIKREEVRPAVKWLKSGGILWYAADQDYGPNGAVFVPFRGIPAATLTTTTKFAKMTGAVVLPLTQKRLKAGGGIEVTVHEPLTGFSGNDEVQDTLAINRFLEQRLETCCADYMWFHRRFKSRPEGEPGFYQKKKARKSIGEMGYKHTINLGKALRQDEKNRPTLVDYEGRLIVILYRDQHWLPLSWFSPVNAFLARLDNAAAFENCYRCQFIYCYMLYFDDRSPAMVEQLENALKQDR